jgi:hypothetical protein
MLAKQRAERVSVLLTGLPRAVLEDLRLADRAADPEGYQSHRAGNDKACTPPPGLHSFVVCKECEGEPDRSGDKHAGVDGEVLPGTGDCPSKGADSIRNVDADPNSPRPRRNSESGGISRFMFASLLPLLDCGRHRTCAKGMLTSARRSRSVS